MLRRVQEESIGDVLRRVLSEANMTGRLEEVRAEQLWEQVVGPDLFRLTGRPTVRRGVMTVRVSAAPLRHELMMNKSSLMRHLNEPFGHIVVRDIRFIS